MKPHEAFRRASKDFLALNCALCDPQLEQALCPKPLAKVKRKKESPRCRELRITSYRTRLLDTDNLCPKYFIDALRYAGIIKDDTPKHVKLQLFQIKVQTRPEEKTVIELEI